jgi:hypothetical protein
MIPERTPELPKIMADGRWGLPLQVVVIKRAGFATWLTVGYACDSVQLARLQDCLI